MRDCVPVKTGNGGRRVSFCVILERSEESRIRHCEVAVKFLRSGQKWCYLARLFTKTFHVKRFLVQEKKSRIVADAMAVLDRPVSGRFSGRHLADTSAESPARMRGDFEATSSAYLMPGKDSARDASVTARWRARRRQANAGSQGEQQSRIWQQLLNVTVVLSCHNLSNTALTPCKCSK
jgi:hypothetical protein